MENSNQLISQKTKGNPAAAPTPYDILGVEPNASASDIRKAYLSKLRLCSPEKNPDGFRLIRQAYNLLINSTEKKQLDLSLFKTASGIPLPTAGPSDGSRFLKECLSRLFISSSDFHLTDFHIYNSEIDDLIMKLK